MLKQVSVGVLTLSLMMSSSFAFASQKGGESPAVSVVTITQGDQMIPVKQVPSEDEIQEDMSAASPATAAATPVEKKTEKPSSATKAQGEKPEAKAPASSATAAKAGEAAVEQNNTGKVPFNNPNVKIVANPNKNTQTTVTDVNKSRIVINLASLSLALYNGNTRIHLYPIGPGTAATPTPTGYFKIIAKEVNPTWTDPSDASNSVPGGPGNPLGQRWMQLQGNYGIHGTNRPESIGHYVSHGCVRMNEQDVEELYNLVKVGTPVEITYNRVIVEKTPDDIVAFYIYPDGYHRQPLDIAEVTRWLKGFGVENFVSDAEIQEKIDASDGQPTYIGKVYNIFVDGKKLTHKAVICNGIAYLPAVELANAAGVELGWNSKNEQLISSFGSAIGYDKKDTLYCNANDVNALYHLFGGLVDKKGFEFQKK
jgi:lipoprotein-anchoring transpeptidase ErfK/SrfK